MIDATQKATAIEMRIYILRGGLQAILLAYPEAATYSSTYSVLKEVMSCPLQFTVISKCELFSVMTTV